VKRAREDMMITLTENERNFEKHDGRSGSAIALNPHEFTSESNVTQ